MSEADRHQQVMAIFEAVCDLAIEEREPILAERCHGDAELRRDVESMLEHDARTVGAAAALESGRGFAALAADLLEEADRLHEAPDRIEGYRILRQIGQGGMGIIYEAEQEAPQRRVAVKVLRPQMITDSLLKRFQHEAHVLGQLQHPGIAQIHEAGMATLPHGSLPFFVMEYVEGISIDLHARHLDIPARLELMARVCDAIQHAHQKGIIHRDLKPNNVLVVPEDEATATTDTGGTENLSGVRLAGVGHPRVLDFGIARVTDADIQAVTVQTELGQLVGTLAYMSPEQVTGVTNDLDTRCDVYALGIMLYELTTGRRPLDLTGTPLPEAARMIREVDPPLAGTVDRRLRGDVETIIAKAMEKAPDRRYSSATELAADLRRFIRHEPIEARPASTFYQLGKFARRNKGFVAGAAVAFVAVTIGLVITSLSLRQARIDRDLALEAREKADEARAQVEVVAGFQGEILKNVDLPEMGAELRRRLEADLGPAASALISDKGLPADTLQRLLAQVNMTNLARDALEKGVLVQAVVAAESRFANDPVILAGLLESLAETYYYLAHYEPALPLFERCLELRVEHLEDDHKDVAKTHGNLAQLLVAMGRGEEAEPHAAEALRRRQAVLPPDHGLVLEALRRMALVYDQTGRPEQAEQAMADVVSRLRSADDVPKSQLFTALNALAVMLLRHDKLAEALPLFEEARAGFEREEGPRDPQTLATLNNLARAMAGLGQLEEAVVKYAELRERIEAALGDDDRRTFIVLRHQGSTLARLEHIDEAEEIFATLLERQQRTLGANHPDTLATAGRLRALRGE